MSHRDLAVTVVLGASTKIDRYANIAVARLRASGWSVIAIGRHAGLIGDVPIQTVWPEGQPIDTVTIYLNERNQGPWMEHILAARPRRIIFNPGAENPAFAEQASKAGIRTLEACTLVMIATGQY